MFIRQPLQDIQCVIEEQINHHLLPFLIPSLTILRYERSKLSMFKSHNSFLSESKNNDCQDNKEKKYKESQTRRRIQHEQEKHCQIHAPKQQEVRNILYVGEVECHIYK